MRWGEVRWDEICLPFIRSYICPTNAFKKEQTKRKYRVRERRARNGRVRRKHKTMLLLSLPQLLLRQAPATSGCCSDEFNESIQRQMPATMMTMTRPNTLRSAICTNASCRTVNSSCRCVLSISLLVHSVFLLWGQTSRTQMLTIFLIKPFLLF